MTRKLYWENAYMREFKASVVRVNGSQLTLDRTAFNPRGGGLGGDRGWVESEQVVDTVKGEGDEIVHVFSGEIGFKAGETVSARLDWDRRYRLMRMHTAAHLLSAVINRETGALITGNQIEPDRSRIDFNVEGLDKERFVDYCSKANEIAKQDLPVKIYFLNRKDAMEIPSVVKLANAMPPSVEELRIVEIVGIDIQADGGPHVRSLTEVGTIELAKFENKGKNNKRVYFTLS